MRIVRAIEIVLLALVTGAVFAFVATTTAPGMQKLVAGISCPSGTAEAYVVVVPHQNDPAAMVRNRPLVCVSEGGVASMASEWKTFTALLLLGAGAALALLIAGRVLLRVVRAGRSEGSVPGLVVARAGPPPESLFRSVTDSLRVIFLGTAVPFVVTAAAMGWSWLAKDSPYTVTGCRSSSGGHATCYDGEPIYRILTLLFGALALAGVTVYGIMVVRHSQRRRRVERAWRTGQTAPAQLVDAAPTNTRINGRRLYRYTYEVSPSDGAPAFTFQVKGLRGASPASTATALYEPGDPTNAVLLPDGVVDPVGATPFI